MQLGNHTTGNCERGTYGITKADSMHCMVPAWAAVSQDHVSMDITWDHVALSSNTIYD